MPTGRKNRVMIACVTFETSKVIEPALYYEINKIHIIRYLRDPDSESGKMYDEFRRTVCDRLSAESPREIEMVVHNEHVSNFSDMLRTVLGLIQSEKAEAGDDDCEVYVNISAGTPEYSAAATVASMMVPGVTPFSVSTREYTVSAEKAREIYYIDGKPVGLTKSTYPPRAVPVYQINIPEEHLVRGLRILHEKNMEKLPATSGTMIPALKEAGLWYRDTEVSDPEKKQKQIQTEAVYYQRDFISKWVGNGWLKKDELTKKYALTPDGESIINTFYVDMGTH